MRPVIQVVRVDFLGMAAAGAWAGGGNVFAGMVGGYIIGVKASWSITAALGSVPCRVEMGYGAVAGSQVPLSHWIVPTMYTPAAAIVNQEAGSWDFVDLRTLFPGGIEITTALQYAWARAMDAASAAAAPSLYAEYHVWLP